MAQRQYTEAGELFEKLGAYEESSKLTMYCKAAAAGESGDYNTALTTFETLGDYKESSFMITYYKARKYESNSVNGTTIMWANLIDAAKLYDSIALFNDSKERAETCRKIAYDYAIDCAGMMKYSNAIDVLNALGDYNDSAKLSKYYEAFMTEQNKDYVGASKIFTALGNYKDAQVQVSLVMQRGYDAASELEAKGDQLGAYEAFIKLGNYRDSFERACKPYYLQGEALRVEGKWDEAVEAFSRVNTYEDAATQVLATYYIKGIEKRSSQDWKEAINAFISADSYRDATTQILETQYQEASALEDSGDQEAAYQLFLSLGDYKDSYERANKPYYDLGVAKRDENEWDSSVEAFKKAGDYSDAKEQISATRMIEGETKRAAQDWEGAVKAFEKAGDSRSEVQIKMTRYAEGEAMRAKQKWDAAVSAFEKAGQYLDANEQVLATRYAEGEAMRAEQKWDAAVSAFEKAGDYNDATTQIKETKYQQAKSYYNQGDYESAYLIYKKIVGYKDANNLTRTDPNLVTIYKSRIEPFTKVNGFVTLGKYTVWWTIPDEIVDIEWLVLEYDEVNNKALLISRYGLETIPYNKEEEKYKDTTWEKCTLRNWLNNDFLSQTFSEEERSAILVTDIKNDWSQGYEYYKGLGGNNTKDKVFLLSYAEACYYFGNFTTVYGSYDGAASHELQAGTLAKNQFDQREGAIWWLRSPGDDQYTVAYIDVFGRLDDRLSDANDCFIRPALWIDLKSAIF